MKKGNKTMAKTAEQYKEMSRNEFKKAAEIYDSGRSGIYEMCKYDYPKVLAELEHTEFNDVLDCGCGTGPMIAILSEKYPKKHYTGLDLTPEMIEKAKQKNLTNAEFVVGDCENLPFSDNSFDVVICTNSFHHYPNPQAFFDSVYRVLRKGGRLILRDYTSFGWVIWLMNHVEMPLANLCGHGDVKVYKKEEYKDMIKKAGFSSMMIQAEKKMRCHVVATK